MARGRRPGYPPRWNILRGIVPLRGTIYTLFTIDFLTSFYLSSIIFFRKKKWLSRVSVPLTPREEALYDPQCTSAVYVRPLWKRPAEHGSAGPLFGPLSRLFSHGLRSPLLDLLCGDPVCPVPAALPEPGPPPGGERQILKGGRTGHPVVPAAPHHPPGQGALLLQVSQLRSAAPGTQGQGKDHRHLPQLRRRCSTR